MTKAEREWFDAITQLGCIVCLLFFKVRSEPERHHLVSGGRRKGHLESIPLCTPHHRGGMNDGVLVSRHPWKKAFERAYGTEQQLLEQTRELVQRREVFASRGETEAMSQ